MPAPANTVFQHLIDRLPELGYDIARADPDLRGVTAYSRSLSAALTSGPIRIAAAVDPAGERRSRVIIEAGPGYTPAAPTGSYHQKIVERILASIEESLARGRDDIGAASPGDS